MPKGIPLDDDERATARRIDERLRHWLDGRQLRWLVAIAAVIVIGGLAAIVSVGVLRNIERISDLQRQDSIEARRASFRTCLVGDINRAEIHLRSQQRGDPHRLAAASMKRIPVRDCSPRLFKRGAPAVPLSHRKQLAFIRFFAATRRAAIIRNGHLEYCPEALDEQLPVTRWSRVPKACPRDR